MPRRRPTPTARSWKTPGWGTRSSCRISCDRSKAK
nr:MAG TPA: Adipokinetic hormone [Caudoviricetes sp.]